MTIDERVQRLEDFAAIRRLLLEYRRTLDEKDFRGYAALFAQEGEFVAGDLRARGPEAIFELVDGMRGTLLTDRSGDDLHLLVNVTIDLDGDRARAESNWLYIVRGQADTPVLAKIGRYHDVLTRENGHWRFLRREAPMDMPAP